MFQNLKLKEEIPRITEQNGGRKQSPSQSERQAGGKLQWRRETATESVGSEEIAGKQRRQPGTFNDIICKLFVPCVYKIG
jgi:hypothetical protein